MTRPKPYSKEAAEAFGRPDETVVELADDDTQELIEELPTDDLDSYADALATDLQTHDTTIEPADDDTQELIEELPTDDLDSYADALATDLQTHDTTIEPADDDTQELIEELPTDDLDSYADALATDLQTHDTTIEPAGDDTEEAGDVDQAAFIGSDPDDYVGEDELGAALAELTGSTHDDLETPSDETPALADDLDEADETTEPPAPSWWSADTETPSETDPPDETPALAEDLDEADETTEPPAPSWWSADTETPSETDPPDETPALAEDLDDADEVLTDETPVLDQDLDESDASLMAVGATASIGSTGLNDAGDVVDLDVDGEDHATLEASAVIDSPVEWGVRYREAHQGWVEDEEGRSTWRPIVTSGESVAGWDIDIYLGLVSGDISIDPAATEAVASEVSIAREGAARRMLDEGLARGAHAIVGVTFSIEDVAGVVLVGASGVAVTLRTPA